MIRPTTSTLPTSGSYTIFGSFSEAMVLVETQTGIDYGQESIFQDSQNFDFRVLV